LSRSGVRVRIITNSLSSTDVGLVHAGYSKYRRALLRAGVELYEVNKSLSKEGLKEREITGKKGSKVSLHAKSFVLDRERIFIGSLNFDPRSVTENTEIGIMLTSEEVATRMVDIFDMVASQQTFRLELKTADDGLELISWHGLKDGREHIWRFDPFTSFFQRLVIGIAGLLPIESQL
jgi:putative cardiolipin synthase